MIKQYLILFLIASLVKVIFQLFLELIIYPEHTSRFFKTFYAIISLSSILYFITFVLMSIIHFVLNKYTEILSFNLYIISSILGLSFLLLFFTIFLNHNFIDTLMKNSTFVILYVIILIFLLFKFSKH